MSFTIWLSFVGVAIMFMLSPGPSHLLMATNTLSNGLSKGIATASGDLSANVLQMVAASLGLGVIVYANPHFIDVMMIAGALYIGCLGIAKLRTHETRFDVSFNPVNQNWRSFWLQGFATSLSNPKAIVFFAALFPQFINLSAAQSRQWFVLGVTYLLIDALFLTAYGLLAERISKRIRRISPVHIQRMAGVSFLIVAVFLALR